MLSISPINSNMQHKRSEPSFKAINIDKSIPYHIVDVFANSKNMDEIAKKFDIEVKRLVWNKATESNFLDLYISRVKEAIVPESIQKSSNNFFSKLFKSVRMKETTSKNKVYEMNLTNKYVTGLFPDKVHPSIEEQIESLTPQKIEEYINLVEIEKVKAAELELKREEHLKKIANFGK